MPVMGPSIAQAHEDADKFTKAMLKVLEVDYQMSQKNLRTRDDKREWISNENKLREALRSLFWQHACEMF